jgi:A/G-specific adenine glycosylase
MGTPEKFPVKTGKLKRSVQSIWMLWAQSENGAVWLTKRPTPGVWAGLYCLPLFENLQALQASVPTDFQTCLQEITAFKHVLTHKDLYLHAVQMKLPQRVGLELDGDWVCAEQLPSLGLPAPIKKLLYPIL